MLEITVAIKEYMPSALATRHSDRYSVSLTGKVEEDYQYGMDRFLDEAKILAKLQNTPHIVSVQNFFKKNGTAYFVMEYIDGMSLKSYLEKNGGKISYKRAISILQPVMEALVQVHGMNLLHRDISPDNIYITAKGESRLLDFGAARFALGDGKSVSVILKHGYAPEEQYSSHGNQGPWTDVYAMGATLYRCITGLLPPDSLERIHGDTIRTPSEMGIRIPADAENAIMKALAVRTENRFPNMEAFLGALNGNISLQEQVAASVSQRTQAAYGQESQGQTVYQQTSYKNEEVSAQKNASVSGFFSCMKAHPIVTVFSCGLLTVVILFVIIPLAFSGGEKKASTGGGSGSTTAVSRMPLNDSEPATEEPISAEMVTRDLGDLNATIDMPSNYEVTTDDGLNFVNEGKDGGGGCTIMINYAWDTLLPLFGSWESVGPIYSLSDVESQREAIASRLTSKTADHRILAAGPDQVGEAAAYQIFFETTSSKGTKMNHIVMAVEGYEFGCYFIYAVYSQGDEALETEIHSIIQSFVSKGKPNSTYKMYYGTKSGVKVIVDDAVAEGRVQDTTVSLGTAGAIAELVIYPTDEAVNAGFGSTTPDSGIIEVLNANQMALDTPKEVVKYMRKTAGGLGASVGDNYKVQMGGVKWLCVDYSMKNLNFRTASAMIKDKCYSVSCTYTSSNKTEVEKLFNQAMESVHAWEQ